MLYLLLIVSYGIIPYLLYINVFHINAYRLSSTFHFSAISLQNCSSRHNINKDKQTTA